MVGGAAERRRWTRYFPVEPRAHLGWWKAGVFRTTTARLINVSRGGAMLETDVLPPDGGPVWVCSAGGGGWVEAALLRVVRWPRGPQRLRLVFRDPATADGLLDAAALRGGGLAGENPADMLAILELSWPCTRAEVKAAYRRLAQRDHPDRGGTAENFCRLNAAYAATLARCAGLQAAAS